MAFGKKYFGEHLRALREKAGYSSPERFAAAAGVAKQTVYNWESRIAPPPPSGVAKIAKILGLSEEQVRGYVSANVSPGHVAEEPATYGLRALPTAAELEDSCRKKLDIALGAAHGIPERLAYLQEQLSGALVLPAHWRTEDRAAASAKRLIESLGPADDTPDDQAQDA